MGWKSEYNSIENIMELTLEGVLDYKALIEAAYNIVESAKKYDSRKYLADCYLLIPEFSRRDLFELSNNLFPEWGILTGSHMALIEPKAMKAKVKAEFYVYTMNKLGWDAAMVPNRKKALAWLKNIDV